MRSLADFSLRWWLPKNCSIPMFENNGVAVTKVGWCKKDDGILAMAMPWPKNEGCKGFDLQIVS